MALPTLRASSLNLTRQFHCPVSISSQRYRNVTHLAYSDDGPPTSDLYPRTKTTNTINHTVAAATATSDPSTPATTTWPNRQHQNKNRSDNNNNNYNPLRLDLSPHASPPPPYRIHVACTPNNTHIVIGDPQGHPLKASTWSGGSCGFKGVNRSGYEAGYQCAVRAFARIKQLAEEEGGGVGVGAGVVPRARFEVIFKGFGQGRDAVFKALMTSEGDEVRPYVVRVTDNTPIKIGGTRARKTRRL